MKSAALCAVLAFVFALFLPLAFIKNDEVKETAAKVFYMEKKQSDDTAKDKNSMPKKSFKIKLQKNGKIKKYSAKEYVTGVLCGEISPTYHKEAIKAQAVAAYTFALYRSEKNEKSGNDFDLTDSPATDQCFIEKSEMAKKWGEKANEYFKIYEDAVDEVLGKTVTYNGETALTVYHAVSSGVTNSAKDVWGGDVPYLCSVDSVGDKLSKNYLSEVDISETEVKEKLSKLCSVTLGENAFQNTDVAKSGRVKSVKIGNKTVSGGDIVSALSLKSGNFEVSYSSGNYHFTVKGRGHGVGLSQEGADYMAKQGIGYAEILLHYFKGCKLN